MKLGYGWWIKLTRVWHAFPTGLKNKTKQKNLYHLAKAKRTKCTNYNIKSTRMLRLRSHGEWTDVSQKRRMRTANQRESGNITLKRNYEIIQMSITILVESTCFGELLCSNTFQWQGALQRISWTIKSWLKKINISKDKRKIPKEMNRATESGSWV